MSQSRLKVVRAIAALAWSDGYLDEQERGKLRRLGEKLGLDDTEKKELESYLAAAPSLDDIAFDELNEKERQAMYLLALHYAYLDGLVWSGEKKILERLSALLRLSPEVCASLEMKVKTEMIR
jgi:uncharacterized membrane protein YebE (DUF533 family)